MSDFRLIEGFKVQPHELAAQGVRGHRRGCFCENCKTLRLKVMTTQAWFELHLPHSTGGAKIFEEPYPHPSGEWIRLVCPCGARQVTVKTAGIIL